MDILQELEKLRRGHYACADSFYSCPKSPDGCSNSDYDDDDCICGADDYNAILDGIISEIKPPTVKASKKKLEVIGKDDGFTVKELKEILSDWPEVGEDGEPTTVWIETGWCKSSPVTEICPLDKRGDYADIEFISDAFIRTSEGAIK